MESRRGRGPLLVHWKLSRGLKRETEHIFPPATFFASPTFNWSRFESLGNRESDSMDILVLLRHSLRFAVQYSL